MYPWHIWLAAWVKEGRTVAEFWKSNPAQVIFVLEAVGALQRKRGARELVAALSEMGVPIERGDDE